jgi:hypothetical protein
MDSQKTAGLAKHARAELFCWGQARCEPAPGPGQKSSRLLHGTNSSFFTEEALEPSSSQVVNPFVSLMMDDEKKS